jgi:Flp pilus assembly protein TadD
MIRPLHSRTDEPRSAERCSALLLAVGLAGLTLAGGTGCTTYAQRTPQERETQWARASQATATGHWQLAASLWNEIRLGSPGSGSQPHIATAVALIELGQEEDALAILDHAKILFPNDGEVLRQRAILLDGMGFERAAETDLLRAIELRPDCPLTWASLGKVQLELGESQQACDSLEHAAQLAKEETPELLLACARASRMVGNYPLAQARYERLLEMEGLESHAMLIEAASLYTDCDPAVAPRAFLNRSLGWVELVAAEDPQEAEAHFVRGLLLEQLGNPVDALSAYERAAEVDNMHLGALNNMALLYMRLHRPDRAAAILERALQLEQDPRRSLALSDLRETALQQASGQRSGSW